jgi:hypothetical protein
MRYKGVTQECTIEKQMLVPKKHLKLTSMRKCRDVPCHNDVAVEYK